MTANLIDWLFWLQTVGRTRFVNEQLFIKISNGCYNRIDSLIN